MLIWSYVKICCAGKSVYTVDFIYRVGYDLMALQRFVFCRAHEHLEKDFNFEMRRRMLPHDVRVLSKRHSIELFALPCLIVFLFQFGCSCAGVSMMGRWFYALPVRLSSRI